MKFAETRIYADLKQLLQMVEIASTIEPVQDGLYPYREDQRAVSISRARNAGRRWRWPRPGDRARLAVDVRSLTYVKFTQAGATVRLIAAVAELKRSRPIRKTVLAAPLMDRRIAPFASEAADIHARLSVPASRSRLPCKTGN